VPTFAIRAGADLLVVGRPVHTATDPVAAARMIAEEVSEPGPEGVSPQPLATNQGLASERQLLCLEAAGIEPAASSAGLL
jgi:hypothetical protein